MRVTVGVSGGIAAYKAAELVRALQRRGVEVHVVMTEAATRFVQPLTFAALSGHKVITSLWDDSDDNKATYESSIEHIGEAQWTEALVVAPATANVLAKFAHGIADDFLTTMYLATPAPVLVAPAMNVNMWQHPAVQANLETLRQRGVRVIDPGTGDLACGMIGAGRMAEPDAIAEVVFTSLGRRNDLAGETVLITAGGTREALDPVRYIGNRSSGKMGYALADAAQSRGAKVILMSGPTALHPPARCEVVRITTAEEMRNAVLGRMSEATMVIKAAAVADYRPANISEQKIKRTGPRELQLEPNPDILAELGSLRHAAGKSSPMLVGFAAETGNTLENARAKLTKKRVDAIVLNDVSRPDIGFNSDRNEVTIVTSDDAIAIPEAAKLEVAQQILEVAFRLRQQHPGSARA